jgi:hypothetical protein
MPQKSLIEAGICTRLCAQLVIPLFHDACKHQQHRCRLDELLAPFNGTRLAARVLGGLDSNNISSTNSSTGPYGWGILGGTLGNASGNVSADEAEQGDRVATLRFLDALRSLVSRKSLFMKFSL